VKKIGITQRVEKIESYGEVRDCLDQEWTNGLLGLDFLPIPIPTSIDNIEMYCEELELDGFILSGGNDLCSQVNGGNSFFKRDQLENKILEFVISKRIPLLGVCRGMQVLVEYFGGELMVVEHHVNVLHSLEIKNKDIFSFPKKVNSFHNYGVRHAPNELEVLAHSKDGFIEAVKHREHRVVGIMWHPERHPVDFGLIKDFFNEEKY